MFTNDRQLLENAQRYCNSRAIKLPRQSKLGYGSDGTVWKTSVPSAVKALYRQQTYEIELECYRRLKVENVTKINGLNVPVLEGQSEEFLVLEITFVQPPFLLDFGKAHLDRPPSYYDDKRLMSSTFHKWKEEFGNRWQDVASVLYVLRERFGIHYVDPRAGNINFGDDDDDDWMAEPGIDYSSYE